MVPSRAVVWASLTAMVLIWGTTWAAIRISLQGFPPLTGVALRFAIAGVVLLVLARIFGVRLGGGWGVWKVWLFNTVFTFCLAYSVLYWAEQWVPSGLSAVLFATYPLWVALLAHFVLPGERLTGLSIVGVLVGFAGVAVIFSEDFGKLLGPKVAFAAVVLLISPVSAAWGNVWVKKWGGEMHPLSTAAVPMALTGLLMAPVALLGEPGRHIHLAAAPVLALLYLALIGSAVPFTLFFLLLKHLPATRLSLINYAVPLVALLVGAVFLQEPVTLREVAGTALVVAGVWTAMRSAGRQEAG